MKAMVLCAGYGTRLGELTKEIPKPMLDVSGKPILFWILNNLKRHGFDEVLINLHFQPEVIKDYFGDGGEMGLKITYINEDELLGTAGGLKNGSSFFDDEPFLVHYGDVVTNEDYTSMLKQHLSSGAEATLLLHQRKKSNSVVKLDESSRICGFLERPGEEERKTITSPWVNSGVAICDASILQLIPDGFSDLPRNVFVPNFESHKFYGYPLSGFRCAIDSVERLELAREAVNNGLIRQ